MSSLLVNLLWQIIAFRLKSGLEELSCAVHREKMFDSNEDVQLMKSSY